MAKNFPTFLGRIANLAEIMISIFTYVKIFEMEMQHIVKVVLILDPLKMFYVESGVISNNKFPVIPDSRF